MACRSRGHLGYPGRVSMLLKASSIAAFNGTPGLLPRTPTSVCPAGHPARMVTSSTSRPSATECSSASAYASDAVSHQLERDHRVERARLLGG